MKQISYADGIVFSELCDCLKKHIRENKDRSIVSDRLSRFVKSLESSYSGVWCLPKRKAVFIEALKAIEILFHSTVSVNDIDAIYNEFTSIISEVDLKCKVTFLVQEYSVWSSLREVYNVMSKDSRFQTKIVYVPFNHINACVNDNTEVDLYRKEGLSILKHFDYNLSDDNPDIVFFSKPYNLVPKEYYISEVEKVVDKTVYIPYGMESTYKLVLYGFQDYLHYRVWRHIVHGNYVKSVGEKFGYRNGENIVAWGHPKMDYFKSDNRKNVPIEWSKKIAGRRVVCWCPHHTISSGPEHISTWLDYFSSIFEWFEKHTDMVLLLRPHPLLFGALVNNGYMTQDELNAFLNEKRNVENIIFDENADYHFAFECSDAMITDGTTFSVEYLGSGKPLMLTTDDISSYYNWEEAQKGLYIGDSKEAVIEFLDNILAGADPKRLLREEYTAKTIFYPKDTTISKYITDKLLEELILEQKNLARSIFK